MGLGEVFECDSLLQVTSVVPFLQQTSFTQDMLWKEPMGNQIYLADCASIIWECVYILLLHPLQHANDNSACTTRSRSTWSIYFGDININKIFLYQN